MNYELWCLINDQWYTSNDSQRITGHFDIPFDLFMCSLHRKFLKIKSVKIIAIHPVSTGVTFFTAVTRRGFVWTRWTCFALFWIDFFCHKIHGLVSGHSMGPIPETQVGSLKEIFFSIFCQVEQYCASTLSKLNKLDDFD